MSVPSVSISLHDRYSPEIRDRILEKLRTSIDDTAYRMLTPAHLRALAETRSPNTPILSLYLHLSPDRRACGAWRPVFTSMTTASLKRIGNKRERTAMTEEIERIQCALEAELPELGRGAAFFACRSMGLWRQIAMSVPVPDSVHWLAQPYIRPLVRTRDEHDRFVLALLSQERSRFFISQIGQVEEVFQVRGQSLSRALADYMERTSRENLIADRLKVAAHSLARAAELVMAQFEARVPADSRTPGAARCLSS